MDKASDFGSEDCRFESCHGRIEVLCSHQQKAHVLFFTKTVNYELNYRVGNYYKRFNKGKGEILPCVGCHQLPFRVTLLDFWIENPKIN